MKRLAALAALAACLLPTTALSWNKHADLDSTASWLAQRPVYVKCLTKYESSRDLAIAIWGAEAYVEIVPSGGPDDHMVVAWPWCEVLEHRDSYTPRDFAIGVLIITHESFHLRGGPGWKDERRTNCWAARRAGSVAELRFGITHEERIAFEALVWDVFRDQPIPYKSSACLPH